MPFRALHGQRDVMLIELLFGVVDACERGVQACVTNSSHSQVHITLCDSPLWTARAAPADVAIAGMWAGMWVCVGHSSDQHIICICSGYCL